MALTFTTGTFGPRIDLSYIDIDADDLILEQSLSKADQAHLEAAQAETTLADYAMPNGQQNASEYFTQLTRTAAELTDAYNKEAARNGGLDQVAANTATINDNIATIDDHETRITTLEP